MAFSLTWLPEVLERAGLKVAEQPGWRAHGRGDIGRVLGVMCHHTAGPARGNMPSLHVITDGRVGLSGPLAQLGLGRDGTFYIVAAGRANHAGEGKWEGVTTGNSSFIGIEAEHTGNPQDPWPDVQMDAYRRGVAALLARIGATPMMCCGHKEYALPRGRKPDPTFDMADFRAKVALTMASPEPAPLIAAHDAQDRPTLRRGARGDLVKLMQTKVGIQPVDGLFGAHTEAAVREFQRQKQIVPDGIVGPKTWLALDNAG